jgi:hypothetical protein
MRAAVDSGSCKRLLRKRDTVATDTSAERATSDSRATFSFMTVHVTALQASSRYHLISFTQELPIGFLSKYLGKNRA